MSINQFRQEVGMAKGRERLGGFKLTGVQPIFAPFVIVVGLFVYTINIDEGLLRTLGLFLFVILAGIWLCWETAARLGDPRLRILGTLWLLKILLTIFLQYYGGWSSQFDVDNYVVGEGYDAYRFYYDAKAMLDNNWVPEVETSYQGIVYYYGVIFFLFGWNPVAPGLVNALITLLSVLYLIDTLYRVEIKKRRIGIKRNGIQAQQQKIRPDQDGIRTRQTLKRWTVALLLLIPEIVYYDVQTSRDSLMAALLLVAVLALGRWIFRIGTRDSANQIILVVVTVLMISITRTTMLLPLIATVGVMVWISKYIDFQSKVAAVVSLLALSLLFIYSPELVEMTGGQALTAEEIFKGKGVKDSSGHEEWTHNSIGKMLEPSNPFETVLFAFPRAIVYLVAPLPTINFTLSGLINGERPSWDAFFTAQSAFLNLLMFPFYIAGFFYFGAKRRAEVVSFYMFYITFIIMMLAIAGGNIIIHERYRLMAIPFYYACIWLSYKSVPKKLVMRAGFLWAGICVLGVVFYFTRKMF